MKMKRNQLFRKFSSFLLAVAVVGVLFAQAQAATLSTKLQNQLPSLADSASVGMTIVAFNTSNGLQASHLNVLRAVGVNGGRTFPTLGMVAMPLTAGQVRALNANPAVRSLWSNDRLFLYMNQARALTGVDRVRSTTAFSTANGGMPVSGAGDFSVMVIDSGVDATHADLQFGTKVIQNVHPLTGTDTVEGFTPNVSLENVPNTDQTVGHGTHCAGIIGGSGVRSGGTYAGVAPGVKLIGAGLGAGLFVLNAVGAWEYGLANQYRYNIRVVSNSYGSDGPFNPDNPINIASKAAYDRNIAVVFAGGNSGPTKNTYNPYAKAPWVIGVAAGTKEGDLADFSSRGTPQAERLTNSDPLDDFDAPVITAPGTGRALESSLTRFGFTTDIVSTRSTSNITANGTTADAELAPAMIPFYTQISGTSMATPFISGVIALMLDADPTLSVDEIRSILTTTATKMPGRADWEVGAGYVNAYAAVDKVFNRTRGYANFQDQTFNTVFGEERPPQQAFNIDFNPAFSGPTSSNARTFTVEPGMNVLDVFATVNDAAGEGLGNVVGLRLTSPSGVRYSSSLDLPVIGSLARQVVVQNPEAGQWTIEVRGASGLAAAPVGSPQQIALPGPVNGTVTQIKYILPTIADINGHPAQAAIEAALKNRVIDTFSDGNFRPDINVTREDFARVLVYNTSLRQSLGATARFSDVTGEMARIAEAVTTKGSTLRGYNFTSLGLMNANGSTFNPAGIISRLDLAVALVRALGSDAEAQNRAGTNVTVVYNGQTLTLTDNAEIPAAMRGYVQLALDKGILQAFYTLEQGPFDFEPTLKARVKANDATTRAFLAYALNNYRGRFITGN